jgi:hypothetical protein
MKIDQDSKTCPKCSSVWEMPETTPEGNHYSRLVGIEIRGGYDGVSYWECPDCHTRWDRWTGVEVAVKRAFPSFQNGTGDGDD